MWLGYLLLIAPLTQGASIKLTKRKLSDPLLTRPHDRRQHISDTTPESRRAGRVKRMIPVPGTSDVPSQPGGQDVITKYVTEQVTVYLQPSGPGAPPVTQSGVAQAPVSAPGGSGGTVYTTVKVYVTIDPPGAAATSAARGTSSLPPDVAALESGQPGGTSLGQIGGVPISLSASATSAAGTAASQSGTAAPSAYTASSSIGISSNATSLMSRTTGAPPASRTVDATQPIATNFGIEPVDPWVYTIDVKLGSQAKVVPLLVDTGSFSFWAAADSCSICTTNGMVGALQSDPDRCTKYDASYGTGHFSGCLVNTTMEFGPYKLDNMAMAAAVDLGQDLAAHGASFSGMFGLALPGREGTTTPMSRLFGDGLVDDPWVGMRLYRQGEGDSEMVFGDALTSPHGDPAFHVELPQRAGGGFKYNITLDSLTILGVPVTDSHINNRGVVLDTGTSNIIVPEARYHAILAHLSEGNRTKAHPTTGTPMLRCTVTTGQSALVFRFGGVDFAVPWKDVVGPKIDLTGTVYDAPSLPEYCQPRIQTIGDNNWILGDSFLVNVYHAINTQTGAVQLWRLKS